MGVAITSATTCEATLEAADTDAIDAGLYYWDLQRTDPGSETNIAHGTFYFDTDVGVATSNALPVPFDAAHFGLVGDGTDETVAMTAFFNSAINKPGVPHILAAKTYLVTAPLPPITAANVWIEGAGSEIHDGGSPLMTGTVIKYVGSSTASEVALVQLGDVAGGAGQQFRGNIVFRGIGLDCNSLISHGLNVNSIRSSDVNVAIANAKERGVNMFLTFVLAEARDSQRNKFRFRLRQIEAPNGIGIVLGGDNVSNISMNEFWVDAQHANSPVLYAVNSDNNVYHYFRAFKTPSGTATESASLLGGPDPASRCRGEKFLYYVANTPMHAYGTNEGFVYPSINHMAVLDSENGTPVPIVGVGASVHYIYDSTKSVEEPWLSWVPDIQPSTGSITSIINVSANYRKIGRMADIKLQFAIQTNGTGGGGINVSLPLLSANSFGHIISGKERAILGKMLSGFIDGGTQTMTIQNYDGTYPGMDGGAYTISGSYEVP